MSKKAVVFAYHNVGVRCLKVLLAKRIEIALVVTHEDNPNETIWFESVASLCKEHDIQFVTPDSASGDALSGQIKALQPDFIFSFYYRHMIPVQVLALAKHGAFNMHGSLLPKYRGRVPVNWAVLHGESETGASLHEMTAKPDAGPLLGQTAVPILPDDTAYEVFGKLTVAAEQTLWQALPDLMAGAAKRMPNDLKAGSYFGGRKPEDGRIDWNLDAQQVYNLHRAVAPPYPGAFTQIGGKTFVIAKARLHKGKYPHLQPGLSVMDNCILGVCGDHRALHILELWMDGEPVSANALQAALFQS